MVSQKHLGCMSFQNSLLANWEEKRNVLVNYALKIFVVSKNCGNQLKKEELRRDVKNPIPVFS